MVGVWPHLEHFQEFDLCQGCYLLAAEDERAADVQHGNLALIQHESFDPVTAGLPRQTFLQDLHLPCAHNAITTI